MINIDFQQITKDALAQSIKISESVTTDFKTIEDAMSKTNSNGVLMKIHFRKLRNYNTFIKGCIADEIQDILQVKHTYTI